MSTWLEEGWISALESLVATSPSSAKTAALWNRVVQAAARAVLGLYRVTSNIHSSFNPHLMVSGDSSGKVCFPKQNSLSSMFQMSGEDMIARFSETADWRQGCLIKSIHEVFSVPEFFFCNTAIPSILATEIDRAKYRK